MKYYVTYGVFLLAFGVVFFWASHDYQAAHQAVADRDARISRLEERLAYWMDYRDKDAEAAYQAYEGCEADVLEMLDDEAACPNVWEVFRGELDIYHEYCLRNQLPLSAELSWEAKLDDCYESMDLRTQSFFQCERSLDACLVARP